MRSAEPTLELGEEDDDGECAGHVLRSIDADVGRQIIIAVGGQQQVTCREAAGDIRVKDGPHTGGHRRSQAQTQRKHQPLWRREEGSA